MSETWGGGVAVVTGAGSGIGAAVSRRLEGDGYAVVLVGRRRNPIDELSDKLGERAIAVAADVGSPEDAARAIATAVERFGGVDVLVNSAGIATSAAVGDDTPEGWDAVVRTNLTGTFLMARAALPQLIERRGVIVNVASTNAWQAGPESASYCASKAGVVMLTRSLAVDYGPLGVRSNCVSPGWVRTPMADDDMEAIAVTWGIGRDAAYRVTTASNPLRRPAEPDDIAAVVSFLAGPDARYVNGVTIPLDGGANVVDDSYSAYQGPTALPDLVITARHHS
jgi:meso-butanediol dehydrogenase / (S,S)-butanediol dehydrogenase / diacetyl reductase